MNRTWTPLLLHYYVTVDDLLVDCPQWAPQRPAGIAPKLSDAELITLAVLQALLRFTSEARFIRYAKTRLRPWFPYAPGRSGCNKRLRHSQELMKHVISYLARECPSWFDDVWVVDSTPVEYGRSRAPTWPGWATHGYSASHSRFSFRDWASISSLHRRV